MNLIPSKVASIYGWEGGAVMKNSTNNQNKKLNLFYKSDKKNCIYRRKIWKKRIAIFLGKIFWIILEKVVDKFF